MNTRYLFLAMSIISFACINTFAMEIDGDYQDHADQHPQDIDTDQNEFVDAQEPPIQPKQTQDFTAHAIEDLKTELSSMHACTKLLATRIAPPAQNHDGHRDEPQKGAPQQDDPLAGPTYYNPFSKIYTVLTMSQQCIAHSKDLSADDIRSINAPLAVILEPNTSYADGINQIDILIDQTIATVNRRSRHIDACKKIISELRSHLRSYINQGIDDITQTPLENSDCNLVREIDAFFLFMQEKLVATHMSLAKTVNTLETFKREVEEIQQHLNAIVNSEELNKGLRSKMAGGTQLAYGFAATLMPTYTNPAHKKQEQKSVQESLEKALAQLDETVACVRETTIIEANEIHKLKTLCTILDSHGNPQFNLYDQKKIESSLIADLIKSNGRTLAIQYLLANVKPTANAGTNTIMGLANYLLTRMYPETAYARRQRTIPGDDDSLPPVQERAPRLPLVGRILDSTINFLRHEPSHPTPMFAGLRHTIDQTISPELHGLLDNGSLQGHTIQPDEQQTRDNLYTTWLINTQNTHYLLYDIAARIRFNTGRFTYLLKPCIHNFEQLMGPYKETKEIQDITSVLQELTRRKHQQERTGKGIQEELNENPIVKKREEETVILPYAPELPMIKEDDPMPKRTTFKELLEKEQEQLPKGHIEQPGERYNTIMRALADEDTPLEHLWLPFSIPPCVIRTLENILRTADPHLPATATPKIQQTETDHFTSTSLKSFFWNGLKHLAYWPTKHITPLITKKAQTYYDYIHWGTDLVIRPFTGFISDFLRNNPYGMRIKGILTRKIDTLKTRIAALKIQHNNIKIGSARIIRSLLTRVCKRQVLKLEQAIREGHPVSDQIAMLQNFVADHRIEGLARWGQAECARHTTQIRAFARRYDQLQRIDPIVPVDKNGEPIETEATIKDARLRDSLGNFIRGWQRSQQIPA